MVTPQFPKQTKDETTRILIGLGAVIVVILIVVASLHFSGILSAPKQENKRPTAEFSVIGYSLAAIPVNTSVIFDATNSTDPDGNITYYEWNFGDGQPNQTGPKAEHKFLRQGEFKVSLTVWDNNDAADTAVKQATVVRVRYLSVTIKELLTEPLKYEWKPVELSWAWPVTYGYEGRAGTWASLIICDNSTADSTQSLNLFITGNATKPETLGQYDPIRVRGEFRNYRGRWEIYVRAAAEDCVEKLPYLYQGVSVSQLLTAPEKYNRSFVRLVGVVNHSYCYPLFANSERVKFKVTDSSISSSIWVWCYPGAMRPATLSNGTGVEVQAYFIQTKSLCGHYHGLYRLKVRAHTSDCVKTTTHSHEISVSGYLQNQVQNNFLQSKNLSSYHIVSIAQLRLNPLLYNNSLVRIGWATVADSYCYKLPWGFARKNDRMMFYVFDNSTSEPLTILAEPGSTIPYTLRDNDIVELQGFFNLTEAGFCHHYHGDYRLTIRNATPDRVAFTGVKQSYIPVQVRHLLFSPEHYRNMLVRVEATVTYNGSYSKPDYSYGMDITKVAFFWVRDTSTVANLNIFAEPNAQRPQRLYYGSKVVVQGIFTYYEKGNRWELLVRESSTGDSISLIGTGGEAYERVTLKELYTYPHIYNESYVILEWATVTYNGSYYYGYDPAKPSYFNVRDNSTPATVKVYCDADSIRPSTLHSKDVVEVKGRFRWYQPKNGRGYWEISVGNQHGEHASVVIGGVGERYGSCTLKELFAAPELYNYSYLVLSSVVVTRNGSYSYGPDYGSNLSKSAYFYVKDNSTPATLNIYCDAYSDRPKKLNCTDKLEIKGLFKWYQPVSGRGNWELNVRRASYGEYVRMLGTGGDIYGTATVKELLTTPEYFNYSYVILNSAIVTDGYNTSNNRTYVTDFYVRDTTTAANLAVYSPRSTVGTNRPLRLMQGDVVNLKGQFVWYQPASGRGYWELKVRNSTTADYISNPIGTASIYGRVSIRELLETPALYNNSYVEIERALVVELGNYSTDPNSWVFLYVMDIPASATLYVYVARNSVRPEFGILDYLYMKCKFKMYKGVCELSVRAASTGDTIAVVE